MLNSKKLVSLIARNFKQALFFQETSRDVLALTIDDMPAIDDDNDTSTRRILDVIDQFNQSLGIQAKVTFFIATDHLTENSTILQEIIAKGHEIGNHGTTVHRHSCLPDPEFETEFKEAHRILSQAIKQPIRWFRPGQAFYNQGMIKTLKDVGGPLGYQDKFALASMIPFDTRNPLDNPNVTLKNIQRFTFPGSILVLHGKTSEQAANTVQVLQQLIPELHQQGYELATFSGLCNQSSKRNN